MTCDNILVVSTLVTMFKQAMLCCSNSVPPSPPSASGTLSSCTTGTLHSLHSCFPPSRAPATPFHFLCLDLATPGTSYQWTPSLSSCDCFTSPRVTSTRFIHRVPRQDVLPFQGWLRRSRHVCLRPRVSKPQRPPGMTA